MNYIVFHTRRVARLEHTYHKSIFRVLAHDDGQVQRIYNIYQFVQNGMSLGFIVPFRLTTVEIAGTVKYIGSMEYEALAVLQRDVFVNQREDAPINFRPILVAMYEHSGNAHPRSPVVSPGFIKIQKAHEVFPQERRSRASYLLRLGLASVTSPFPSPKQALSRGYADPA